MARLMAIDYGDARTGIALTDPMQIIASAHSTLPTGEDNYAIIVELCREKEVEGVVIGIPFNQDDGIGEAALKVLRFAAKLKSALEEAGLELPLYEQDERYSTRAAHDAMRQNRVKKKRKRQIVDQIAAANILKSFMDSNYKTLLDIEKYLKESD